MKGYSFRSLTDLVLKIFKTKVNAGTGLSGGGSLEADRTLAVKYGTTAGTATQGNDNRLSDSREWTAATINQAEAEAGTAITRRAFTAQRVRQATVAWWNSITGVFGRDLVTSDSNTAARDKLGLFTSALRWPTWAEVTGKPTTFTPSAHTHPWSQVTEQPVTATRWPSLAEVTGTPANYPTTWNSVAAKPAQAIRWPTFAEVTDKPVVQTTGASTSDIMSQKVTTDALNTKADLSHTHPWSQVTGQPATATRWPTLTEVTGKPTNYPTTWSSVAAKPAQATRWPTFAEVVGKPETYTPSSHTHPTSQITGLDAALNTKASTSTQVFAGTGLSGGGSLAANRTLSIDGTVTRNSAFDNSLEEIGWQQLQGGLIIQWGRFTASHNQTFHSVTFPIAFPNNALNVSATLGRNTALNGTAATLVRNLSRTGVQIAGDHVSAASTGDFYWFAVGH